MFCPNCQKELVVETAHDLRFPESGLSTLQFASVKAYSCDVCEITMPVLPADTDPIDGAIAHELVQKPVGFSEEEFDFAWEFMMGTIAMNPEASAQLRFGFFPRALGYIEFPSVGATIHHLMIGNDQQVSPEKRKEAKEAILKGFERALKSYCMLAPIPAEGTRYSESERRGAETDIRSILKGILKDCPRWESRSEMNEKGELIIHLTDPSTVAQTA